MKETTSRNVHEALISKALADDGFKAELKADPVGIMRKSGIDVPEGITIKIVENSADTVHLVLPSPPLKTTLRDDQLDGISGGTPFEDINPYTGFPDNYGYGCMPPTDMDD